MAKEENKHKTGSKLTIQIGGLPDLPYINQPQHVEIHDYVTPPVPIKKDILFVDYPKKDQYWRRVTYPKLFYEFAQGITETTEEEHSELMECVRMDIERRIYGLWFMNNGVPTYITGHNYFHLQWGDMLNGEVDENGKSYPDYREFQRDYFYFLDLCIKDHNCLGGFTAKAKKVGVTQMMASMYANEVITYEKIRLGVMSKTGDECRDTNIAMISYIIDNLPPIITPKRGGGDTMKLFFGHPTQKQTGTKQYQEKVLRLQKQKVLNSVVIGKNTKVGAFDGPRYKHVWCDEFPKYHQSVKISPKAVFDKDSAAVKLQQQIKGKFWATAYTPEVDDIGFLESKTIYYESKKITIKQDSILKRTKSNLYCYHISSLYATEGTFDIYGKADVAKAFQINDEERQNAAGDLKKTQALIRQGARNEDESWMVGGSGSVFDNIRLQDSVNLKERMVFMNKPFYRRVNLEWEGIPYKSFIKVVDDPNGKWYFTRMLPSGFTNKFMMADEGRNVIHPYNEVYFTGGVDPFSYMDVDEDGTVGGSKGASYTIALPNKLLDDYFSNITTGDTVSKRIVAWYCERPTDPNVFFEDMVKETLFFGKRILIENNKEWLTKLFKDKGLKNFLLFKNIETKEIEKYKPNKKQKEKSTQTGDVDEICRIISEYLSKPNNGEPDYCMLLEDVDLLSQLMRFNPLKTKTFDRVMAFGYTLMALNSFSVFNKPQTKKDNVDMGAMCRVLASM